MFGGTSAPSHRVGALIGRTHLPGEGAGGKRFIPWELGGMGPRTVPQVARAGPGSRQHVRHLADRLSGEGWVELADNPAYEGSRLARPTPREGFVEEIERRDAEPLGRPETYLPQENLRVAAGVLWPARRPRGSGSEA